MLKEKARERDNPRNIAQTSGYGKDRTAFTFLAGDPFFQLQAVALALLRVVRLAAGFLVRLGVVVGAAEAGCMGAGAEPSGALVTAPTSKPYPCSPPLPLLHTQAHEKAAMRTAREPMRTAAK